MRIIYLVLKEPALLLIFLRLRMFTNSVASPSRRTTTASDRCPTRWPTSSSSASRWWTQPVSRTCVKNGCRSCRSTRPVSPTCSSAPRWALQCSHQTADIPRLLQLTSDFHSRLCALHSGIQNWCSIFFVPDLCVNIIKEMNPSLDAIFCADTLSAALW